MTAFDETPEGIARALALARALENGGLDQDLAERLVAESASARQAVRFITVSLGSGARIPARSAYSGLEVGEAHPITEKTPIVDLFSKRILNAFKPRFRALTVVGDFGLLRESDMATTHRLSNESLRTIRYVMERAGVSFRPASQEPWSRARELFRGRVPLRLLGLFNSDGNDSTVSAAQVALLVNKFKVFNALKTVTAVDMFHLGIGLSTVEELMDIMKLLDLKFATTS